MTLWSRILSSLRAILQRSRVESEMDAELRFHVEACAEDLVRSGVPRSQALRRARIEFGGIERAKEECRDARGVSFIEGLIQDVRFGLRMLRKNPGFTAAAVLTLALGIGATTAIFSVVYGVLLRPLPFPEANRLVAIWEVNHHGTYSHLADPNFDDFRDQNHTFQAIAKYNDGEASVVGPAGPMRMRVASVTHDFFEVLGVAPVIGRSFASDDAHPGAAPVLLASHRYWKEYLASARDLSPFKLRIEDRIYSVVGILPQQVEFPEKTDLWLPAELYPENTSRTSHSYLGIGRLRNGVSVAQAATDLGAIAERIVQQSPEQNEYLLRSATAVPLQASLTGGVRSRLYILLGAVGFLLLVACANVANFLLAQASKRARELAVRNALGAGRTRLVQQFITETLLLSGLSCVVGVLVALGFLRALLALAPQDLPRIEEVTISWPVLVFTAGISFLAAVGLGILAALRATSSAPGGALVEGGRGNAGTQRSQRMGRAIVAAQLAITLALLTGAGLLGRSMLRVLSVDPGFRTDNIVTMDLQLPQSGDLKPDAEVAFRARESQFVSRLIQRLHAIPGVQQVATVNAVPMDGGLPDGMFLLVSPQENPKNFKEYGLLAQQAERRGIADYCAASPEYFQALGIPLLRGRFFDQHDGFDSPHVAVITESLARLRWPHQDPIGRTIQFGNMDGDPHLLTIVGVAGDTHEYGLEQQPRPTVYVNLLQRPRSDFSVVMHAEADFSPVIAAARAIVHDEAPDVPPRFRTFTQIYSASLGSRRFNLTLVVVFALTALLLAVAGVYGVVAYGVAQRTQEIGVRMALGARSVDVLRLILRQGLTATITGVAIGIVGSFATARTIQSLLFDVKPTDPLTFIAVAASLIGVAGLACYVPARRAMKVDPLVALHYE
jgi:putative ABC transport system permease protein